VVEDRPEYSRTRSVQWGEAESKRLRENSDQAKHLTGACQSTNKRKWIFSKDVREQIDPKSGNSLWRRKGVGSLYLTTSSLFFLCGRPRERSDDSSLRRLAVRACQAVLPYGAPRTTDLGRGRGCQTGGLTGLWQVQTLSLSAKGFYAILC
jgi:hypothetical protein